MNIYGLIRQECKSPSKFSRKYLAELLGLNAQTFSRYVLDKLIQPHQEEAIREALRTRTYVDFPNFRYECGCCGKTFESQRAVSRTNKKYCSECARDEGKRIEAVKPRKKPLSITDILRIGKKYGIVGEGGLPDYGKTVQAIEKGEIKV